VNIFFNYEIIEMVGNSFLFVAHGRFVSVFNVILGQWTSHIRFEGEINELFKVQMERMCELGILLRNNEYY